MDSCRTLLLEWDEGTSEGGWSNSRFLGSSSKDSEYIVLQCKQSQTHSVFHFTPSLVRRLVCLPTGKCVSLGCPKCLDEPSAKYLSIRRNQSRAPLQKKKGNDLRGENFKKIREFEFSGLILCPGLKIWKLGLKRFRFEGFQTSGICDIVYRLIAILRCAEKNMQTISIHLGIVWS